MPDDLSDLVAFLQALESQVFIPLLEQGRSLLRDDLAYPAIDAWPSVQRSLASLRNTLTDAQTRLDSPVRRALEEIGLTGIQLQLKLQGFFGAIGRRVGRLSRRWLREVLAWANVILGSLARVLPAAEVVKEYKECLEVALDYSGRRSGH